MSVSEDLDAASKQHLTLMDKTRRWDEYLERIADGIGDLAVEQRKENDERKVMLKDHREERTVFFDYIKSRRQVPLSVVMILVGALAMLLLFDRIFKSDRDVDFTLPGMKGTVKKQYYEEQIKPVPMDTPPK